MPSDDGQAGARPSAPGESSIAGARLRPDVEGSEARPLRVQLWSYNYDPEPSGIAPLSTVWAQAMMARGHAVEVVAAHPHYPEPRWGRALKPYREHRDGVPVLRLPLWAGRGSGLQRLRQEASFAAALSAAAPWLRTPDVIVAVSPSFPALVPAMANARLRRVPWVLWLQDILPDGATRTGILDEGKVAALARRLERAAYRSAKHIVVISESFEHNLHEKGVDPSKLTRIYNPASRPILESPRHDAGIDPATVMSMGNIGYTQNLVEVVRAFERSSELDRLGARMVLAGDGEFGAAVRAEIRSERVRVTGMLGSAALERELQRATVAVVSQRYDGIDFNVPSKLMNFMGYGIPVVASVRAESEVARIVERSGAGWVTDSSDPAQLASKLAEVLRDRRARREKGEAGLRFAREHFTPERLTSRFTQTLAAAVAGRNGGSC